MSDEPMRLFTPDDLKEWIPADDAEGVFARITSQARDAALEEAAQLVETAADAHDLHEIAARIRARKKQA